MKSEKEIRDRLEDLLDQSEMHRRAAKHADEIETPDQHWTDRHDFHWNMMKACRGRIIALRWVLEEIEEGKL